MPFPATVVSRHQHAEMHSHIAGRTFRAWNTALGGRLAGPGLGTCWLALAAALLHVVPVPLRLGFPHPSADALVRGCRPLLKIEADAIDRVERDGWRYARGQKVRQIAFGGFSLNLCDLAAEKIRDVVGGASPTKSATLCWRRGRNPRGLLLAPLLAAAYRKRQSRHPHQRR
jgi:hypothetical protein